ncbi:MAG TPA: cupin domain-containing protein [Candidatus Eremiobacteraceae bacterium]|nr:cupin domain-containing protein [Candidatus Eremiobacteraceae bacterium]
MRRTNAFALAAIAAVLATVTIAARADNSMSSGGSMMSTGAKPAIFTPSTVKWMAGTGEFKGLTVAYMSGDPSKAGPWTIRFKVPAGGKFPVHYHNDAETVTVISGTFEAAIGDTFDASKLMMLPAGTYVYIPAGVKHFAMAKTDCVVQVSGTKPFAMVTASSSM